MQERGSPLFFKWCAVFTLWFAISGAAQGLEVARVMVLASYHAGLAWSDDQIAGVRSQLQPLQPAVDMQLDFLDTKHIRPNPQYYQRLDALLMAKYGTAPPKVLLAIDDDALDFALRLRQRHYPGVPILFSGVAASRAVELAKEPLLSGVFDDIDVAQSLTMMLGLLPNTRRLVVVHDQSRTSLAQVLSVRQVAAQRPNLEVEYLTDLSAQAIQQRLARLTPRDLVFTVAFNRDGNDRILSHEEASDLWAAASKAPVAVTRDVSMRPGILGGHLVTGRQQGETLGKLAVQVLLGHAVSNLPMQAGTALPTFDYGQLRRWGIAQTALPPEAVVLNQPPGTFDALRPHLPWLLALFGGMLVIIALLVHGIRVRHRSEAALRLSAQNYRELFNSNTDAIVVRDATAGAFVEINPRFESMFGYNASELASLTPSSLSLNEPPYSDAETTQWMEKTLQEGPQFFEWRARRKDGSLFWSEISMTRYQSPDGLRIVSTVRDISDRKLAETQARAFEYHQNQIYQNLPIAVFAIDAQHRVTFWNPQLALITGTDAHTVVGSTDTWRGIYPSPRPCLADVVVDGMQESELQRLYAGKLRPSSLLRDAIEGEDFFPLLNPPQGLWLRFCAAPLRNAQGDIVGAIETIIDVTELKRTQHTLEDLNQQLENRVQARTQELESAMGQLVQSKKMAALGSLVAGVAHELNTPLGNVITVASALTDQIERFGQMLVSGAARRSDVSEGTNGMLEASRLIERNAARAATLVANFKQVAVTQDRTQARRFSVAEVLQGVATLMAPSFREQSRQLLVDTSPDLWIHSHAELLEQVILHLVNNALHHAFEGRDTGQVHLQMHRDADTDMLIVVCTDDGCGIAPSHLKRLFEPFFTTKLGHGGSGMGLYIAYNLATGALGGTIEVDSTPGQGARFTLRIPCTAPTRAVDATDG